MDVTKTPTNEPSIWLTRNSHDTSAVLRRLIHTSGHYRADTEYELIISARKTWERLWPGAPVHDGEEDGDGNRGYTWNGEGRDLII